MLLQVFQYCVRHHILYVFELQYLLSVIDVLNSLQGRWYQHHWTIGSARACDKTCEWKGVSPLNNRYMIYLAMSRDYNWFVSLSMDCVMVLTSTPNNSTFKTARSYTIGILIENYTNKCFSEQLFEGLV